MTYTPATTQSRLDAILLNKSTELTAAKALVPLEKMKSMVLGKKRVVRDFKLSLKKDGMVTLIAEIKKASPSLGDINTEVDILEQAKMYELAGADAISVLTDAHFKGEIGFLEAIRGVTTIPILRKDFIFDPYQIYESYYYGADALLLIATALEATVLKELVDLTHELGMECLVETHTEEDMEKALSSGAQVIGINARNLKTFEVNLETIMQLAASVPKDRILVAESGIENKSDVERLVGAGAKVILVGTTLMTAPDVGLKIQELKIAL